MSLRREKDDGGKVAVFFAIIAMAWITLLGLVIVGGGQLRAFQRADNVAAEAARAAGQAIDPTKAIPGGDKVIDPGTATAAALAYLTDAGATGEVTVLPGGTQLRVKATITYANPTGVGKATWEATGYATATLLIG
ncbi:hypothetical protein [Catelliglobosispora koreensis]|uniref:hypothetical protein n=1 Tax=Catelliglobosispora koreensis TaxID=129052 RepID=UPI00035D06B5|nr:hypothetical protein [Catelliglobosispora koreensis]